MKEVYKDDGQSRAYCWAATQQHSCYFMPKLCIMHFGICWSPSKSVVYRLTQQFEEPGWFEFWKTPVCSKRSVLESVANLEEPGFVLEWKLLRAPSVRSSRTWKIWEWAGNITPGDRREEPQDSWEFYFIKLSEFCDQIYACFRIRLKCCLKIDQRGEEQILHFPTWTTRKEVYSTAHGYLTNLVFSLMESALNKLFQSGLRKIPRQTQEGDNYVIIGYLLRITLFTLMAFGRDV
jgi:hypothetical protein